MVRGSERGYTSEDLELFTDLDRAVCEIGLATCLIGGNADDRTVGDVLRASSAKRACSSTIAMVSRSQ